MLENSCKPLVIILLLTACIINAHYRELHKVLTE